MQQTTRDTSERNTKREYSNPRLINLRIKSRFIWDGIPALKKTPGCKSSIIFSFLVAELLDSSRKACIPRRVSATFWT